MSLARSLQQKYGQNYQRHFSKDFREAVKGLDSITRIVSKAVKENKEDNKSKE